MSPHAVTSLEEDAASRDEWLRGFSITQNGFLPAGAPLESLPDPYYLPWERLVCHLPDLLRSGNLHNEILKLPVLSTKKLRGDSEWRRAYVVLTFLMHAFVWGGEKAQEVLPPAVSVPLLHVSEHVELPPVATYAALNLWNFASSSGDFADLDSLKVLHTFTGTQDEAWFYLVSVAMEAEGGRIVSSMLSALDAIKIRDYGTIATALEKLCESIRKTGALLERMYEHNDPMVFFHEIRPFLAGSKNMGAAGLPNGIFYDEGDGRGSWRQLRGGSNGQSSLIQFLDIVLGVEHTSHGSPDSSSKITTGTKDYHIKQKQTSFHEEVRDYMPGPHRRFLEHVAQLGSIRELAVCQPQTCQQEKLRDAYQAATRVLTEFRNKHLQIVARYIVLPSKRAAREGHVLRGGEKPKPKPKLDLASASEATGDSEELTGTGGTSLLPFLKQTRDETLRAGQLIRPKWHE